MLVFRTFLKMFGMIFYWVFMFSMSYFDEITKFLYFIWNSKNCHKKHHWKWVKQFDLVFLLFFRLFVSSLHLFLFWLGIAWTHFPFFQTLFHCEFIFHFCHSNSYEWWERNTDIFFFYTIRIFFTTCYILWYLHHMHLLRFSSSFFISWQSDFVWSNVKSNAISSKYLTFVWKIAHNFCFLSLDFPNAMKKRQMLFSCGSVFYFFFCFLSYDTMKKTAKSKWWLLLLLCSCSFIFVFTMSFTSILVYNMFQHPTPWTFISFVVCTSRLLAIRHIHTLRRTVCVKIM